MKVENIPCGCGALTTPNNGITCSPGVKQRFLPNPKIWANNKFDNGMMMDPAAHTQHMNVLKHLVYVWSVNWNHSMWICSFNDSTMVSLVAHGLV